MASREGCREGYSASRAARGERRPPRRRAPSAICALGALALLSLGAAAARGSGLGSAGGGESGRTAPPGLEVEVDQCSAGSQGQAPADPSCQQSLEVVEDETPAGERQEPAAPPAEKHEYSLKTGKGRVETAEGVEELTLDLTTEARRHKRRSGERRSPERGDEVSTDGGSPFSGFGFEFVSGDEALARFAVPPFLLPIYVAAGRAYGVPWNLLAAINQIETDFGRVRHQVSRAGALGWMQFMPKSWRLFGVDATGDGVADPFNPVDAIYAAARYLRMAGANRDLRGAVFAYNHADWYVDRVLKVASIYGSLPGGLVVETGSLAFGRFPVLGPVRYGDDFRAAQLSGRPAAGLLILARGRARVLATQNVTVSRILLDRRLASAFRRRGRIDRLGLGPAPADPALRQTSTFLQAALIRLGSLAGAVTGKPVGGPARLAASIARATRAAGGRDRDRLPGGYGASSRRGISVIVRDAAGNRYRYGGLRRVRPSVRPGARLRGGQVIGRLRRGRRAGLLFSVQAAGGEAVDPRPLVDGYRLQEAADFYHAVRPLGGNPFVPDAGFRAGAIVRGRQRQLARRVLRDPGIQIYPGGRLDIERGIIDKRVLGTLLYLRRAGLDLTVTSLRSGHSYYTAGGNVSAHSYGAAVDISAFNGQPVAGSQGPGSLTEQAIRLLMALNGPARPAQLISLMDFGGPSFAMADHYDHLHVGYGFQQSLGLGRTGNALGVVDFVGGALDFLGTGKVSKRHERQLSRRLGGIPNPKLRRKRGRGALPVESESRGEREAAERLARRKLPLGTEPTGSGARLIDIAVPARARGDEAYAIGLVDGGARRGWARSQTVLLAHRRGAWRVVGPPRTPGGRTVNPRLRSLSAVSGGRGYAVGAHGRVVQLRGRRQPLLLRRVTRASLNGVAARRRNGRLTAVAVGRHGTVVELRGRRARRERVGSGRATLASVALERDGAAVIAGSTGAGTAVLYRRRDGFTEPLDASLGLPPEMSVTPLGVAAGRGELWVTGAIADSRTFGSSGELPFAAQLGAAGWRSFCAGAPALAAVAELGQRTEAGCGAGLGLDSNERGRATDVAITSRGVVVATAAGLQLFSSESFRPLPVTRGAFSKLGLSPTGRGWALGVDGRMARIVPAGKRSGSTGPLSVAPLPLPGAGKLAAVAVAPGGDRALALAGGDAAAYRDGAWRAVKGAGLGLRDAAWAGAERAWAIADTGELVTYGGDGDGGWSAPGESWAQRRVRAALAEALGGAPLVGEGLGAAPAGLRAFAFRSPVEGYAAGTAGLIMRFDGVEWKLDESPSAANLADVAAGPGGAIAAGEGGSLLARGPGGWSESPEARELVRGQDFTRVAALADGTLLAAAAGSIIEHRDQRAGWTRAPLEPLGVPIAELDGYRDGDGLLHALALVEQGGERVLLEGDSYGWRPLRLPSELRPDDFELERASRLLWAVGNRQGRPAAARLGLAGDGSLKATDAGWLKSLVVAPEGRGKRRAGKGARRAGRGRGVR